MERSIVAVPMEKGKQREKNEGSCLRSFHWRKKNIKMDGRLFIYRATCV